MTLVISDPSLRDGNHAVAHQLSLEQIEWYARKADVAGVDIIEVGHGNGLGASTLLLGFAAHSDIDILKCARKNIKNAKLGVHAIPGFAKLSDLEMAINEGVDVIRVASHCTEADTTERYIDYVNQSNKTAFGVLMMSHQADLKTLLQEAIKMQSYGAQAIIIMDSAGAYTVRDTIARITLLKKNLSVPVGFHAHNNLSLAVANSLAAIEAGATIIDATIRGFGAGSGNTALEILIAILDKYEIQNNINLDKILELSEEAESKLLTKLPQITTQAIISGLHGIFSGFDKHIQRASQHYGINPKIIYQELAKRKVVAGQEDMIIDVCMSLKRLEIVGV